MNEKLKRPAVVILAAGFSERMGIPKYELRFSDEETFLDHIIKVYKRFVVSDIVLVVNNSVAKGSFQYHDDIKIVINQNPEYGRFHSVQLGLGALAGQDVFIQNIDNPFVNAGLLLNLWNGRKEADYIVPVNNNRGGHPILILSKTIESIKNEFDKEMHFKEVLRSFQRKNVAVHDPYITVNINTKKDYKKYFSRLSN